MRNVFPESLEEKESWEVIWSNTLPQAELFLIPQNWASMRVQTIFRESRILPSSPTSVLNPKTTIFSVRKRIDPAPYPEQKLLNAFSAAGHPVFARTFQNWGAYYWPRVSDPESDTVGTPTPSNFLPAQPRIPCVSHCFIRTWDWITPRLCFKASLHSRSQTAPTSWVTKISITLLNPPCQGPTMLSMCLSGRFWPWSWSTPMLAYLPYKVVFPCFNNSKVILIHN